MTFEEAGKEITGTFDAHMKNMRLTVDLGLTTKDKKISYNNNVQVSFKFKFDLVGVPNWIERKILDPIFGYTSRVRRRVEDTVRSIFASEAMRKALSDAITQKISSALGSNPKIVSAAVSNNQLKIRYYNA